MLLGVTLMRLYSVNLRYKKLAELPEATRDVYRKTAEVDSFLILNNSLCQKSLDTFRR